MLALFPRSATLEAGVLAVGGIEVTELAERFGTPLVVYCEETLRERARLFARAAPGALVVTPGRPSIRLGSKKALHMLMISNTSFR